VFTRAKILHSASSNYCVSITTRAAELIKLGVVNLSALNKGAFYNLDVNVAWANVLITPGEWRYWGT
jgi:hypothetical protein